MLIFRDYEDEMATAEQFLAESEAYSTVGHQRWGMIQSGELPATFSNAKAAGFNLLHGVELFLKGCIWMTDGAVPNTHSFPDLVGRYKSLYAGAPSEFTFRIDDLASMRKDRPWEAFLRYPVDVWLNRRG